MKLKSIFPAKEIHGDSCGNSGQSETPQNGVRGGSRVTRGKRSVFPQRFKKHQPKFQVTSSFIDFASKATIF
ncbi:hypothetical protein OLD84_04050 [Virgibacillus natechei]|nr:hypothetical protein [Virgibacillus natechei]UZD14851.1 hypothetical protein OLD84_04050 [Virgibacillus natechei]